MTTPTTTQPLKTDEPDVPRSPDLERRPRKNCFSALFCGICNCIESCCDDQPKNNQRAERNNRRAQYSRPKYRGRQISGRDYDSDDNMWITNEVTGTHYWLNDESRPQNLPTSHQNDPDQSGFSYPKSGRNESNHHASGHHCSSGHCLCHDNVSSQHNSGHHGSNHQNMSHDVSDHHVSSLDKGGHVSSHYNSGHHDSGHHDSGHHDSSHHASNHDSSGGGGGCGGSWDSGGGGDSGGGDCGGGGDNGD